MAIKLFGPNYLINGFPSDSSGKELTCQCRRYSQGMWVQFLGWEDSLEKGTSTHSSILTWEIPWTEEPGRLQSMGLQRVRHDFATEHSCTFNKWNC